MPEIYLNGVGYGPKDGPTTFAPLSDRAIADDKGNNIKDTYVRDPHRNLDSTKDFLENSYSTAGAHNSIFMGRNITDRFNSGEVYEKIADGSFEDLFVGDYFVKLLAGVNHTCRIAGFDIYKDCIHDYPHHAVIVPDGHFGEAKMNPTNTVVGGYLGSAVRKSNIPSINTALQTAFGANHLVTLKDWLTNAVDASVQSPGYRGWSTVSSSWVETDSIAELMTEIEVYGTRVWSSSGYDIGIGKSQLPLFALAPQYINPSRYSWWLRCFTNSWGFISQIASGEIGLIDSNITGVYVRPRWCIC